MPDADHTTRLVKALKDALAAPGALEAAPLSSYSTADQAFYKFWYSHMMGDLMQPPLVGISHSVARYIWDAAIALQEGRKDDMTTPDPVEAIRAMLPVMPKPSCIVTYMGQDRPQSFMLAMALGVALMERPIGSTLHLHTDEQVQARETLAIRAALEWRGQGEAVALWQKQTVNMTWADIGAGEVEYWKKHGTCIVRALGVITPQPAVE